MALSNFLIGVVLTYFAATRLYGWTPALIVQAIVVSEWAALSSLLITLQAERIVWVKKNLLNRSLKTWALISLLYLGQCLWFVPQLREGTQMVVLFIPLLLCTGLIILVFGPIQDRIVRQSQRKALGLSSSTPSQTTPTSQYKKS